MEISAVLGPCAHIMCFDKGCNSGKIRPDWTCVSFGGAAMGITANQDNKGPCQCVCGVSLPVIYCWLCVCTAVRWWKPAPPEKTQTAQVNYKHGEILSGLKPRRNVSHNVYLTSAESTMKLWDSIWRVGLKAEICSTCRFCHLCLERCDLTVVDIISDPHRTFSVIT